MVDQTRRQQAIMDLVRDEDVTRVAELARRLGVSDETIRRNLKGLVEEGLLIRRHGAVGLAEAAVEAPFRRRMRANAQAKRAIAALVASKVRDGQSLMIDTGSTTAYVAQALAIRRRLTVVTNSLEIARHLVGRNDNCVYMAGGELRADLAAAVGQEAAAFIRRFQADVAILSVAGADPDGHFADFDLDEARIARAMIEGSASRLIVADHSKLGRRAPVTICDPAEINELVTDQEPPADVARWLDRCGLTVSWPGVDQ
ncbi:DeoR/GlpR family DNA-binding transcription regulator [Hansschlegelia quercus]|uniref:DeoR/GlpR transcriptional regulator n=1 Tax=Hansschlegelia quercus TaxID=2528245 RepID=A0A4Q9GBA4_9HYPH|nr:DeoR/GlpR family DNA-binding transcription regulator [Hansschlegelia quercus]TBN48307.1 DeoR/GlpR transcriptional regulator [Hansschlegelia quercus]